MQDLTQQPRARQRALCIGVSPAEPDLSELRELLRTAGVAAVGELVQRRDKPDPDRYFGRGKLDELKRAIKDADANLVACDDELLPRQERNLEEALGVPVIDRTAIILDIFADHAHSAEGKLQVELAQLEYNLARMRGLWTHLERLGAGRMDGGIGTRGPGETQIETDRRLARDRIAALRRRLKHTKATRSTMRAERERAGLPTVALAGYTNAGKSTLLNALTGAEVSVRDRLFHTLDPTTRSFEISGRTLPRDRHGRLHPQAAARARRRLLGHARGGARRRPDRARGRRLGARGASCTRCWRPSTTCWPRRAPASARACSRSTRSTCSTKSAAASCPSASRRRSRSRRPTASGLSELREAIEARFLASLRPMELLVPYDEGTSLSELHDVAGELEREDTAEGVRVRARVPVAVASRFERFQSSNGSLA